MDYRIFPLDKHTWRIEEYDEGLSVYMYLLEGTQRAMLIDSGMGIIDVAEVVRTLTKLPVDVILTHAHFDHLGGNPLFDTVYIHKADQGTYQLHSGTLRREFSQTYDYREMADNVQWIQDGTEFDLGRRVLRVIHTPGHSLGSVCILDVERKWLFTGDTCCKADVLLHMEYSTSVEEYAQSIRKLQHGRHLFTTTWPAHHCVPVEPTILDQFQYAAEAICGGYLQGEKLETPFGEGKRLKYKDIAVVYQA